MGFVFGIIIPEQDALFQVASLNSGQMKDYHWDRY